ncbi:anhydro-N-acetylmuramic acid kinase [Actinopolymorpha sp. B9G3]|uniref:anhydro-N-acetylmuramic acid kinase n=1 Tax=Actinopolymorpha sp. B9G3 TaxID=3158970 RepID=UPI0032D8E100
MIGLMSGTSYDGIDVAVADLSVNGEEVVLTPLGALEHPHTAETRELIDRVLPPAKVTLDDVCRLDTLLGQTFAAAAARGIDELAGGHADLVVSHGQTVFHWIENGAAKGTLQLGQPAWIAERTGAPVVSDLRARDIAKGGQGAPLVSILDVLLMPPGTAPKAALNLGGIANMTVVRPDGGVLAYDIGPANALMDLVARRHFNQPYDLGGRHAASGQVVVELLGALLEEPYYGRPAPKSTGKELFHGGYLDAKLSAFPDVSPPDLMTTLAELTAIVVAEECEEHGVGELLVSGGGVRNTWLMRRIGILADPGMSLRPIDDLGLPADAKEAYAFALLGFLTSKGIPATVPACTGASAPSILGSITPGTDPITLDQRPGVAPTRLRIQA